VFFVLGLALATDARSEDLLTDNQINAMKGCVEQGKGTACIGLFLDDCEERASEKVAPSALKAATWCLAEEADFWQDIAGISLSEPSPDICPTDLSETEHSEPWSINLRDNEIAKCRRNNLARQALAVIGEGREQLTDQQSLEASVETCFGQAITSGDLTCVGTASRHCQSISDGGQTTLGIVGCNGLEYVAWKIILDTEYKSALRVASESDAAEPSPPENATDAVWNSQRTWLAFRDAQCAMEYAKWGHGSMRNIASTLCLLHMTAERAVSLRNWYQGEQDEP
jgi:uncharacterized protein YecT (DUF1311 family)